MKVFVYKPYHEAFEKAIKANYVLSVLENDEVDENFRLLVSDWPVYVKVRWDFRYVVTFDSLTIAIEGKRRLSGSYQTSTGGSTATINASGQELVLTGSGDIYKAEDYKSSTTHYYNEKVSFKKELVYKKKEDDKGYRVAYGEKLPAGTTEGCRECKFETIDEIPDYVDRSIKSRLKRFDIFSHLDVFNDLAAEKVQEDKKICSASVKGVPEYDIKSEYVLVYPIYSLETEYGKRKYYVDEINVNTFKISTYKNHTAPRSRGYIKARRNYFIARAASVFVFLLSFISTLLLYIHIEQNNGVGGLQLMLVMKLILETIVAIIMFRFLRPDSNWETSYQLDTEWTWKYIGIYFGSSVLIEGIACIVHFL